MDNFLIAAFITGLTAGGISCFAVQGGLLTGSFARQVEVNKTNSEQIVDGKRIPGKKGTAGAGLSNKNMGLTVLLFLAAKLAAYTLLGLGLGWLGSVFYLSPMVKGILQIAIGIFLLGNALRMFDVHPIFRYFSFEPPSSLTRFIRKVSKGNDQIATPLFLGALTILIPCGVTQSVMAVAVGSGNPLTGAAIMFAFILGTSPTFFGVTILAGGLAKMFQKYFYPVVALVILALGVYTIDGGLNILGSPYAPSAMLRSVLGADQPVVASTLTTSASDASDGSTIRINVKNSGYEPNNISAPAGRAISLVMVTDNVRSCSRAFVIPALNMGEVLPASGETVFDIPAQPAGSTLEFTCSMGMYTGVIHFQ
ncbi:MAG: sulfite exporter TauE/SafE family protein [Anaerolineae bacterium]|nr:sulfite exporter TauE/SafE family protein [Anaerolineae bacterium]